MNLLALSTIILLVVVTVISFSDELKNWIKIGNGRKRVNHNRRYYLGQPHDHKVTTQEDR